jgi:hypothetical protein
MFRFFSKDADSEAVKYNLKENVIEGVEIFRTGVFRGNLFDQEYLQALVDHFQLLKELDSFRDVPVRVDHPDMFGLKNRMNSVVGYVARLYLKDTGKTLNVKYNQIDENGEESVVQATVPDVRLVADMEITEPDAFEKIRRTTYRNRSVELGSFADNDGNTYSPTFMGVAWVDIPQVDKLNSLFSKDMKVEELNREDFEKEETQTPDANNVESDVEDKDAQATNVDDAVEGAEHEGTGDDNAAKTETEGDETENKAAESTDADEADGNTQSDDTKEDQGDTEGQDNMDNFTVSKTEYMEMANKIREFEMTQRFSKLEVFIGEGRSTPALFELESKLVKSFFSVEGQEGYLTPLEQFELLLEMKTSTPTMWEKKDEIVAVDDTIKKNEAKKEYKVSETSDEDVKEFAKKLVAEAGLNR